MQTVVTEQVHSQLLEQNEKTAKVLRNIILLVMSNQMAINIKLDGVCTAEAIVKRLYHDRLVGYNKAIFDESLSLWDRVKAYATDKMDSTYGRAMATRFGFTLEDGTGYDVNMYPGDMRILLRGDQLHNYCYYIVSLGAKPHDKVVSPRTDGINHINIYSKGRTALGKFLSMFSEGAAWFKTPHGDYRTLEGYYHFLRILEYYEHTDGGKILEYRRDPRLINSDLYQLRTADGSTVIRIGRKLKQDIYGGTNYKPKELSRDYVKYLITALIYKISKTQHNPILIPWKCLKSVCESGYELKHYYVVDGEMRFPQYNDFLPNLFATIAEFIDPNCVEFEPEELIANIDTIVDHYYLISGKK